MEVPERSDGQLVVQHEGKVIAHQEAPPKAGALRAAQGAMAPTPEMAQVVRNLSQHGLTRRQLQRLAALGAPADQPADDENEPTPYIPPPRQATPRKQALWKAVQHAKLQGVPLRGIARQLGISRNTVRKYVDLSAPPINQTPRRTARSETHHHTNGHFHWTTTAIPKPSRRRVNSKLPTGRTRTWRVRSLSAIANHFSGGVDNGVFFPVPGQAVVACTPAMFQGCCGMDQ